MQVQLVKGSSPDAVASPVVGANARELYGTRVQNREIPLI